MPGNKQEVVIVYGAGKNDKTDANHLGTLQWILASLNYEKVARVTILDFVDRTIKQYTTAGKEALPMELAVLSGADWLFTYLAASEGNGMPPQVGAIEVITHSDFNGFYVGNGYSATLSPQLPPDASLLAKTKKRLAKPCRIKLWGCNGFQMVLLKHDDTYGEQWVSRAPYYFRLSTELIRGFERIGLACLATYQKSDGYGMRGMLYSCVSTLTKQGHKKALKKLAENIVKNCFVERKAVSGLFTEVTAYAVALSDVLETPIIASPWGVGASGLEATRSEYARAKKNALSMQQAMPTLYNDWFKAAADKFRQASKILTPAGAKGQAGARGQDAFMRFVQRELGGVIAEETRDGPLFKVPLPRHRADAERKFPGRYFIYDWKLLSKRTQMRR